MYLQWCAILVEQRIIDGVDHWIVLPTCYDGTWLTAYCLICISCDVYCIRRPQTIHNNQYMYHRAFYMLLI
ncbi:hypothetical protein Hanom_Chr09g00864991 [Helianthus anomalus]